MFDHLDEEADIVPRGRYLFPLYPSSVSMLLPLAPASLLYPVSLLMPANVRNVEKQSFFFYKLPLETSDTEAATLNAEDGIFW